ncbi:MAG: hypothetical protein ACRENP_04470 [Longimicrobiales bacterium]
MASQPSLPGLLGRRGSRTVLCAGNGLSIEALSLALLGFNGSSLGQAAILWSPVRS